MAKKKPSSLIPAARIERAILMTRGQKVLLDMELASLYGVTTKALEHLPPEQLVADIIKKEQRIMEIMGEIQAELAGAEA